MNDTESDERELLSEAHISFLQHQHELNEMIAERALNCWYQNKGKLVFNEIEHAEVKPMA